MTAVATSKATATAVGPKAQDAKFAAPLAVFRNVESANYVRTWAAVVSAIATGILGITGLVGFSIYVVQHLLIALALLWRMPQGPRAFFVGSASKFGFVVVGLTDNILLFILFWTLAYTIVHIY